MLEENDVVAVGDDFRAVNPYCLEHILALAGEHEMTVCCDIVDERGLRLCAAGTPVSGALRERVRRRRLRQPLETSLAIDAGVPMPSVVADCIELMSAYPALAALGGAVGARRHLTAMSGVELPPPLRLLLAAEHVTRRHDYDTSLGAAIVAAGLADALKLSDLDAGRLILAAVVHDIGEMYIDPAYLSSSHRLQPDEWRHVTAHPATGQAFLSAFTPFPAAIGECVLHHHERPDGSGYPQQLPASAISRVGALLGLADTVSALFMRGGVASRVGFALRVTVDEFPPPAVAFITQVLGRCPVSSVSAMADVSGPFAERVLPTLRRLKSMRQSADELAARTVSPGVAAVASFARDVLCHLDGCLRTAGVYDLSRLDVLENDPASMSETCLLLEEVRWRLRDLARVVYQRAGETGNAGDLAQAAVLADRLNAPD
jgi:hypothetical protein